MNKGNIESCYYMLRNLDGNEVRELLSMVPFENLLSFVTIGINIIHKEFFDNYDKVKEMNVQ